MNNKKIKIIKIMVLLIGIILYIGITIYLFPIIQNMITGQGQANYVQHVKSSGIGGVFMIAWLEMLQIALIFLPGEPVEVIAGMCFGSLWGTVIIMVSAAIVSTAIFFLSRKLGKSFIYSFWSKERIDNLLNSKLLADSKKLDLVMLVLFLMPGTPKDLLVYIAGILPLKPLNFLVISSFARFPSVISSTIVGDMLLEKNYKIIVAIYVATFIFSFSISFSIAKPSSSSAADF